MSATLGTPWFRASPNFSRSNFVVIGKGVRRAGDVFFARRFLPYPLSALGVEGRGGVFSLLYARWVGRGGGRGIVFPPPTRRLLGFMLG